MPYTPRLRAFVAKKCSQARSALARAKAPKWPHLKARLTGRRHPRHVEEARLRFSAHVFGHIREHFAELIEVIHHHQADADFVQVRPETFPAFIGPYLKLRGPVGFPCGWVLH